MATCACLAVPAVVQDQLFIYSARTGELEYKILVKYPNFKAEHYRTKTMNNLFNNEISMGLDH
jgi:hypothetical protein